MQGGLGFQQQASGLRLAGGTHFNRQHTYGLCLLECDGLRGQHSDCDWDPV